MVVEVLDHGYLKRAAIALKMHKKQLALNRAVWHSFHWMMYSASNESHVEALVEAGFVELLEVVRLSSYMLVSPCMHRLSLSLSLSPHIKYDALLCSPWSSI